MLATITLAGVKHKLITILLDLKCVRQQRKWAAILLIWQVRKLPIGQPLFSTLKTITAIALIVLKYIFLATNTAMIILSIANWSAIAPG